MPVPGVVDSLTNMAVELGFHWCGIAPAIDSAGFSDLVRWIDAGYAGQMSYIPERLSAYRHPNAVLEGVRSIIVLATPYTAAEHSSVRDRTDADQNRADQNRADQNRADQNRAGRIARYAWSGADYHDVIHPKLKRLCAEILHHWPESKSRGVVDTAPLMEREIAQLAGFGWRGKNTLLLNKQLGSYFFLSCLLTDVELPTDQPHESSHCGSCTACLDACPTDAFPQPGVLDASRCISYLTIEHRDPIDIELRQSIGPWLFGCDICQEVCPWNRKPARHSVSTDERFDLVELPRLFELDEDQFRQRFRKTPLWRTRRRGILRNAAIVIGNLGILEHLAALRIGLWDDDSMVRGAAAWALGQFNTEMARTELKRRLRSEPDAQVQFEIQHALSGTTR